MLQARRLEKVIDNRVALSIAELDLAAGDIVAVVGPVDNQSSLLIRLLCGIVAPSGGSVTFDGQNIHQSPAARAHIGVLFADDLLYERHTAQNNLELFCQLHDLPASRVATVLEQVGLRDQAQTRISKLSPSNQRRVAFARALLPQPAVLLLDQPALHTDTDTQIVFAHLIAEIAKGGTAVLLTDENMAWAAKFCTQVIELEDGRVTQRFAPIRSTAGNGDVPSSAEQTATTPERLVPYKVPGRKDDRIMLFDPVDILYATSRDGRTILRTAKEEATTNLTLQELEQRLMGRGFFKAHRAYLVNLQHIKSVIQFTRNSYTLQLNDDQETMIPLSKQSERELQELLGY
jgi:ABC-2 type transport system ATP-binding protein